MGNQGRMWGRRVGGIRGYKGSASNGWNSRGDRVVVEWGGGVYEFFFFSHCLGGPFFDA